MEYIIADESFLDAVKAWANFSYTYKSKTLHGKPDVVNEAMSNIQSFLGDQDVHIALGFNECYFVLDDKKQGDWTQIDDWYTIPPDDLFQDTVPYVNKYGLKLHSLKTDNFDTGVVIQQSTEKEHGLLVLASSSSNLMDLHGHWTYCQKSVNVPPWFLASSAYRSTLSHDNHAWRNLDKLPNRPVLFGSSYDYIQPWASNTFCQATALGFAIAFTSDDKDMQCLVSSYESVDQDKFDNLIQKQKWFKDLPNKDLPVQAWILSDAEIEREQYTPQEVTEQQEVPINLLGSELLTQNAFARNFEISFSIVKHIAFILKGKIDQSKLDYLDADIKILDDFLLNTKDAATIMAFDR